MAKILLVEDDTNLSEIYQARMEAEGYEVVSAADGESALAVAAKVKPDLIISDVMMPKISGFEMLDILRNTPGLKDTPVIMLTALGQSDDKGRADQLGADRYLVKSQVTLEDIVNAAHALLEGDNPSASAPAAATAAATVVSAATDDNTTPASDSAAIPAPTAPLGVTEPAAAPVPDTPADESQQHLAPISVATPPDAPAQDQPADPTTGTANATDAADSVASTETPANNGAETAGPAEDPTPMSQPPETAAAAPVTEQAEPETPPQPPGGETAEQPDSTPEDSPNFPQGGSPSVAASAPAAATAVPTASAKAEAIIASSARSTSQESNELKHKIEGFEHRPVTPVVVPRVAPTVRPVAPVSATTPPAPPQAPVTTPTAAMPSAPAARTEQQPSAGLPAQPAAAAATAPAAPISAHAIDEKVVDRAIEQLLNKSPQATTAAAPAKSEHGRVLQTTGTIDNSPASNIDRPQKKVISPIVHPPTPSLAELVAMEEAKEMANAANAQNLATQALTPAVSQPAAAAEALPQAVLPSESAAPSPRPASAAAPAVTNADSLRAAAAADPSVPNVVLPGVIKPTAATTPPSSPTAAAQPAFDPNSIAL